MMRHIHRAGAGLLVASLAWADALDDAVLIYRGKTFANTDMFLVLPSVGSQLLTGGLALDKARNLYVSEIGPAAGLSSVFMLDDNGKPVRIFVGLDTPTDVEVSADQRSLLISESEGRVVKRTFGVSIGMRFSSASPDQPVAFLKTDQGTLAARLTADGYFHFTDVLLPVQTSKTVDLDVRNGVFSKHFFDLKLSTDPEGRLAGHTLIYLTY